MADVPLRFRFERMERRPDGIWVDVAVLESGLAVSLVAVQVDSPAADMRELLAHEVRMSTGVWGEGAGGPRRVLDRYVFRPDGSFEHAREEGSAPPQTRRGRWTLDGDDVVVVELDA